MDWKPGDRVTFDYRSSDDAPMGPFGFPRASLETAVFDGTLHCFPQLAPLNHGLSRAITVLSTPGSCVDIQEPTPASGYASGAYEKVAAVTMACWAAAFAKSIARCRSGACSRLWFSPEVVVIRPSQVGASSPGLRLVYSARQFASSRLARFTAVCLRPAAFSSSAGL